jgi:hypothetical protein
MDVKYKFALCLAPVIWYDFHIDGLRFASNTPKTIFRDDIILLRDFKFRDMMLDIEVMGTDSTVTKFVIDDVERGQPKVPILLRAQCEEGTE